MAAFKNGVRLVNFAEKKENSVHLTRAACEEEIVLTTHNQHIKIIQLRSQHILRSWSVKSGQHIIGPVVEIGEFSQLAALINKQTVRIWKREEDVIDKALKIILPKPSHQLLAHSDWGAYIVYADWTLSRLSNPTECAGVPFKVAISQADIVNINSSLYVVLLAGCDVRLCVYQKENDNPVVLDFSLKLESSVDSSCRCLAQVSDDLVLKTFGNKCSLKSTYLTGAHSFQTSHDKKLPLMFGVHAMASLGKNTLAVISLRKDNEQETGIGIWDETFGTLQAWIPLPEEIRDTEKFCITAHGGHLLVSCTQGVYAFPYTMAPATLGAALGKQIDHSICLNVKPKKRKVHQLFSDLIDTSKTPSLKAFKAKFAELTPEIMGDQNGEAALFFQQPLILLLQRCLREEMFWPSDILTKLVEAKLVPISVYSELFAALAKRADIVLLYKCVQHLPDIPESAIYSCLNCYLRIDEKQFSASTDEDMEASTESTEDQEPKRPFSKPKTKFVDTVLALPFNDIFLLPCLRKLDFTDALSLLSYLYFLLCTGCQANQKRASSTVTLLKVVDWISLVLDAHFTQLILSPEARSALVDLHQVVESQAQLYDELVGLESILIQLKERGSVPQKENPGLYSIHTLHVY